MMAVGKRNQFFAILKKFRIVQCMTLIQLLQYKLQQSLLMVRFFYVVYVAGSLNLLLKSRTIRECLFLFLARFSVADLKNLYLICGNCVDNGALVIAVPPSVYIAQSG